MRPYWTFRDDLAVVGGIIMKGRYIIIPEALQKHSLDQLQSKDMDIEKTRLLEYESIYWVNMNVDIKNTVKACSACHFVSTKSAQRIILHEIPGKPWEWTCLCCIKRTMHCTLSRQVPNHQKYRNYIGRHLNTRI